MPYAADTAVPVERSRSEIERLLGKHGSHGFVYGATMTRAMVGFETADRRIQFVLPLVPPTKATEKQRAQFVRSRWRALLLCIKAKLESVESGIETFDEAFMPHIVMPDGKTIAERALPAIAKAYETGTVTPLLPFFGGDT